MARTKTPQTSDPSSESGSRKRGRPRKNQKNQLLTSLRAIQISDSDVLKWMQLVELRGSSNELYRMADRFQANLIVTGILTIQEIYKGVASGIDDEDLTIENMTKLTTSFNRAVASINQALSYLGVTGHKREEEPETDALADFLKSMELEAESLPILQTEFLVANKDMAGMVAGGDPGTLDEKSANQDRSILAKLKEPMKSYQDSESAVAERDEKVIDFELERSSTL